MSNFFRRAARFVAEPFSAQAEFVRDAIPQPDTSATDSQQATNLQLEQQIRETNALNQANIINAEAGITSIRTDDGTIVAGPDSAQLVSTELDVLGGFRDIARRVRSGDTTGLTPEILATSLVKRTVTDLTPGDVQPQAPNAVVEALSRRRRLNNGRFGRGATELTSPIGLSSDSFQRRRLLG